MVERLRTPERFVNSRMAFVFPGQGSQAVGMGRELRERFPTARRVFNEADEVLGFPLSKIMLEGDEVELTSTKNSQPAILTVSIASLRALEETLGEKMPHPSVVTGHSLGLWTAAVVGEVISFSDGVKLVRERGQLMEKASKERPGTMAAIIGIKPADLEDVCRQSGAYIANVNSAEQIVISGDHMAIARAMDLAASRGARKAVLLGVGGAFHSPLMKSAQEGLEKAMSGIEFRNPQVPLIGNSDGEILTDPVAIKAELIKTLCGPVQWKDAVLKMIAGGVTSFVEIGTGNVLTGLIKRIDRSTQAFPVNSPDSIQNLAAAMAV